MSTPHPGRTKLGQTQGQTGEGSVLVKAVRLSGYGGPGDGGKGGRMSSHTRHSKPEGTLNCPNCYCLLHGEGAIKKFIPVVKTSTGPGGKPVKNIRDRFIMSLRGDRGVSETNTVVSLY